MKTVGVRHLSVPDKSYQNHCCYLTQYPPSNTHHQYYFRQLEHCVNTRGNIFWHRFLVDLIFILIQFLDSFLFLKVSTGKVPFSVGLKPPTEQKYSVLNTLSFSWIIFDIWSQLTLSFIMLILLISHCAHTEQSYWLLSHCPHHSLSSQYYSWNTSDIEFLTLTNYPPIIQRDTMRTISGNSN